jgi:hypothetical protein
MGLSNNFYGTTKAANANANNSYGPYGPSPALTKTTYSPKTYQIPKNNAFGLGTKPVTGLQTAKSTIGGPENLKPKGTGYSSRAAAIAAGVNGGNRSSTSGSGNTLKVSGSGLGPGETSAPQRVTSTGQVVPDAPTSIGGPENMPPGNGGGGNGGGGIGSGGPTEPVPSPQQAEAEGMTQAEYDQLLADAENNLLEPDFIGFQGDRAAELRRLRNYRNQLYGNSEFGTTGSVQRQGELDGLARRRLAAQAAASGTLQGGAYAGTQRGTGTMQRADQDYAMQEMLRPYQEQVASDRLTQQGLNYDPTARTFGLSDFGNPDDLMGGWSSSTFAGQEAYARARQQALQQLLQQGITI